MFRTNPYSLLYGNELVLVDQLADLLRNLICSKGLYKKMVKGKLAINSM